MTPRIVPLPCRKVVRLLRRHGFVEVGQRGSHVYFRDPMGRKVTVPRHEGRDIGVALLRSILTQAGIDLDHVRR